MFCRNKIQKVKAKMSGEDCKEDITPNHNNSDLFNKCIHDIRNLKKIDKEMINNICNMSNENKMNIIITFNDVVESLKDLL